MARWSDSWFDPASIDGPGADGSGVLLSVARKGDVAVGRAVVVLATVKAICDCTTRCVYD